MTYHIVISCDNAAFDNNHEAEVATIITRQVLPALAAGYKITQILRDTNGNKVGTAYFNEG